MIRVESAEDQVQVAKAYEANQDHLFEYWDELSSDERKSLLAQLATFDPVEVQRLFQTLTSDDDNERLTELRAPDMIRIPDDPSNDPDRTQAVARGWQSLHDGEVAILTVAGGQGTRLRFDGPKGMYPVGPVSDRTLFQLFAEQVLALRRHLKRPLTWIIMTSEENDATTREYFRANSNFGIGSNRVVFAQQGMLPVVDRRGRILMRSKSEIVRSPDGHGSTIRVIRGLRETLEEREIRYLFYMQVDNPMIPLCDPAFLGYHILRDSQLSSKAISKIAPEEKLGVFCQEGNKLIVVEYSELTEHQSQLRDADGLLTYRAGNLANHVISMDLCCPTSNGDGFEMPYHIAHKATDHMRNGELVVGTEPNSIKFESFLFDALPYARNPLVVEAPRSEFAPIKNLEGDSSPETCRRALIEQYGTWLTDAGVKIPRDADGSVAGSIEISPLFAASAQQLKERLASRSEVVFEDPLVLK